MAESDSGALRPFWSWFSLYRWCHNSTHLSASCFIVETRDSNRTCSVSGDVFTAASVDKPFRLSKSVGLGDCVVKWGWTTLNSWIFALGFYTSMPTGARQCPSPSHGGAHRAVVVPLSSFWSFQLASSFASGTPYLLGVWSLKLHIASEIT